MPETVNKLPNICNTYSNNNNKTKQKMQKQNKTKQQAFRHTYRHAPPSSPPKCLRTIYPIRSYKILLVET